MAGKYVYLPDLKVLQGRVPDVPRSPPPELSLINTPLVVREWQSLLELHPDKEFSQYLLNGFTYGFRIGFNYKSHTYRAGKRNMASAVENPQVVEEYLAKERELGRVIGPLTPGSRQLQINHFGVIPKSSQPGKWRLIVDLSHPDGFSINDGIEPELCSLSYASVDSAVAVIMRLGRGTILAKLDLESAYRIIPVHPDDRLLLGMEWDGNWFIDSALPFGLRSAPKIFTAMADGLLWIMAANGVTSALHYLDDYLIFGSPGTTVCGDALTLALSLCKRLGVPVSQKKLEGPATTLVFLGVELDTEAQELRLPGEKLSHLRSIITAWRNKKSCTKRDLLSLIGHLQHACKVVRYGRTFLRRMINLSTGVEELHHHIRLNASFRSDLQWWATFIATWNGVSMMLIPSRASYDVVLISDASGNWGCGAYNSQSEWFQFQWPREWRLVHITIKELLPIVLSCAAWGHSWKGKSVKCLCDNAAVVAIINSGRSKVDKAMHLMRCLTFFLAHYGTNIFAEHLPGKDNIAADALSRDNLTLFHQQVPRAAQLPTKLPQELILALVTHQPDWTSPRWRNWFDTILRKV